LLTLAPVRPVGKGCDRWQEARLVSACSALGNIFLACDLVHGAAITVIAPGRGTSGEIAAPFKTEAKKRSLA
jgi:hypothetical protein